MLAELKLPSLFMKYNCYVDIFQTFCLSNYLNICLISSDFVLYSVACWPTKSHHHDLNNKSVACWPKISYHHSIRRSPYMWTYCKYLLVLFIVQWPNPSFHTNLNSTCSSTLIDHSIRHLSICVFLFLTEEGNTCPMH